MKFRGAAISDAELVVCVMRYGSMRRLQIASIQVIHNNLPSRLLAQQDSRRLVEPICSGFWLSPLVDLPLGAVGTVPHRKLHRITYSLRGPASHSGQFGVLTV
jgi:hypothetical protein